MRIGWRAAMCLLLATLVCLILVSPLVASPPTTLRSKQAPPVMHAVVISAVALVVEQSVVAFTPAGIVPASSSGRDLLDLTSSRLC